MLPKHLYPILMIALPVIFRLINRKITWFSIVFTVAIELIVYWNEFSYYEGRPFMIFFTLVQIVIMIILTIVLNLIGRKKRE